RTRPSDRGHETLSIAKGDNSVVIRAHACSGVGGVLIKISSKGDLAWPPSLGDGVNYGTSSETFRMLY
ncbi:MAG: hypothetical protein OES47_14915, partial [Acidobacteriota bacterium]|nr:hypothetical protein [Acidobacteriota bacterium]